MSDYVPPPPPPPPPGGSHTNIRASLPPPPSAAVPPTPPRAPLTRRTKWSLATAGVLGLAIIIAVMVWRSQRAHPSAAELRSFLTASLGDDRLQIASLEQKSTPLGEGVLRIEFLGVAETTVPLYRTLDLERYLRDALGLDPLKLRETRQLIASPASARLREIAELGAAPPDPLTATIIEVVTPVGTKLRYAGNLVARPTTDSWVFEPGHGGLLEGPPRGQRRDASANHTYVANDPADVAAIRAAASHYLEYGTRLADARIVHAAELARRRVEREAQFMMLLKKGALFSGVASNPRRADAHKLSLEIVEISEATHRLSALLRNEGGWSDARAFQGEWGTSEESEECAVTLSTRADQAVREAGPFLDAGESWSLAFELSPTGAMIAKTREWEYRFERVTEAMHERVKAELSADLDAALQATASGTLYQGVVVSKRTQASEKLLLRFNRQEANGTLLAATLESLVRDTWKRRFRGTVIANRFRAGDKPVRLQSSEPVEAADSTSLLGHNRFLGTTIALRPEDSRLVGEDNDFMYRFERATPEWIAAFEAARAAHEQRFFAIIKAGAAYDGTIRDRRGFASRARLQIVQVDSRDGTVDISFESREQRGIFHRMRGAYDLADSSLRVGSAGGGKYNPSGALRVPIFSYDANYQATLSIEETSITGTVAGDWSLDFPIHIVSSRAQPATAAAEYPTTPGAYVFRDGEWHPLPRNGGKLTYGAAQVLNNVSDLLGALSGSRQTSSTDERRPDKLAYLSFTGAEMVPAVNGDAVVIAYVGNIKSVSPDLLVRYPELANEPPIEMAPTTRQADGSRRAPLFRVVPGIAGFRESRVAAQCTRVNATLTTLTCNAPLSIGTYAIAVHDEAYEVTVR